MNFWETITGSDLTREWKAFEARAQALPASLIAGFMSPAKFDYLTFDPIAPDDAAGLTGGLAA